MLIGGLFTIARKHGRALPAMLHLICFDYHIYFILIINKHFIKKRRRASRGGYKNLATKDRESNKVVYRGWKKSGLESD
jgi:hypothetical protein